MPNHDLLDEFYNNYPVNLLACKIDLLYNEYDSQIDLFTEIENDQIIKQKTIRSEIHFILYQLIEALFELIFCLLDNHSKNIWLALTLVNDRKSPFYIDVYNRIRLLSENSLNEPDFNNQELLHWLFFYGVQKIQLNKNFDTTLSNIKEILLTLANIFSNRNDYNAW